MSVGGDTDDWTNPFEVRLGKFVDLHVPDDTIGIGALRRIKAEGIRRHQLGIVLEGGTPAPQGVRREDVMLDGQRIGTLTNCVWSWRMQANIGFVLIDAAGPVGTEVTVSRASGLAQGRLVDIPFL